MPLYCRNRKCVREKGANETFKNHLSWSNMSCPDVQQSPTITGVSTVVNEGDLNTEGVKTQFKTVFKK